MSVTLEQALAALLNRILVLATQDAELRTHVRSFAEAILSATDDLGGLITEHLPETVSDDERVAEKPTAIPSPMVSQETEAEQATILMQLPELTLGRSASQPAEIVSRTDVVAAVAATDLALIESRCRLKAKGARWAATRRRMMAAGADFYAEIDHVDRDLIVEAKALPNCFLWLNHPSGPSPVDLNLYEEVAGCFETLADAVSLVKQIQDDDAGHADFKGALNLLAEAQSALRVAVGHIEGDEDNDQVEVFHWLLATASRRQTLIPRFMRLDDPADPSNSDDLAERIEAEGAQLQATRQRMRQRKKLLGKLRYKVSEVVKSPAEADDHWITFVSTVEQLLNDGLPPSDRELREILLPVVAHLPDTLEVPKGFRLVLREMDRYLATCSPPDRPAIDRPTQQIMEAARLLRNKALVVIGGECRPAASRALKEAFGIAELYWVETQEHDSIQRFEPYVARADVAVVLLAIRWSSHSYGEVATYCDRHSKPLVRLPAGYNPNQVAAQIMNQCSERLK